MMNSMGGIRFTAAAVLLAASLQACSSSEPVDPNDPVEIPTTSAPIPDSSERELFESATKLYESGHLLVAREKFQALKDGYPLGPYAQFSELKIADTYFFLHDYAEAAPLYEQAFQNYPSSPSAPYALLKAAHSHLLVNTGVGRDREPLEKALELLSKLEDRYSGSRYLPVSRKLRQEAALRIAEHEELVADYYRKIDNPKAYRARLDERKWPKSPEAAGGPSILSATSLPAGTAGTIGVPQVRAASRNGEQQAEAASPNSPS